MPVAEQTYKMHVREAETMANVQRMLKICERKVEKVGESVRRSNKGIFDPVVWEATRERVSEEN